MTANRDSKQNPDAPARSVPLPCPFCGSDAIVISRPHQFGREWTVSCTAIECDGRLSGYANREGAVEGWNRRAPQPSSDGLASLKAKIEALPVEQIEMRILTDDGMSWNATKVFDMLDRNSVLALLKAPTADGGTT